MGRRSGVSRPVAQEQPPPSSRSNRDTYGDPKVARHYAEMTALEAAERAAIDSIAMKCRSLPVLDLGVGGGRTTPALLAISNDYIGVDYSEEMVTECRARFPGVRFELGDARRMEMFPSDHFALVMFSFNGLDYQMHYERMAVLGQVYRMLRSGGFFLFSSHNLLYDRRANQHPFRRFVGRIRDYTVDLQSRPDEERHRGETAYRYRRETLFGTTRTLLTCYIAPTAQTSQLRTAGLICERIYDSRGNVVDDRSAHLGRSPWLYYLASK